MLQGGPSELSHAAKPRQTHAGSKKIENPLRWVAFGRICQIIVTYFVGRAWFLSRFHFARLWLFCLIALPIHLSSRPLPTAPWHRHACSQAVRYLFSILSTLTAAARKKWPDFSDSPVAWIRPFQLGSDGATRHVVPKPTPALANRSEFTFALPVRFFTT